MNSNISIINILLNHPRVVTGFTYHQLLHGKRGDPNTSEAEEGIPSVLSQEVMSLQAFETLVLMQNHFEIPIRAKAAAWFKDAVMKKRVEESLKLEKTAL